MLTIYLLALLLPTLSLASPVHLTARQDPCASPTDVAQSWLCEHPEIPTAPVDSATIIAGDSGTVNPSTVQPLPPSVPGTEVAPSAPVGSVPPSSDIPPTGTSLTSAATRTMGVKPTYPATSVSAIPLEGPFSASEVPTPATESTIPNSASSVSAVEPTSSAALPSNTPGSSDCSCGYSFSDKFNSAYYPKSKIIDFSTIPDGTDLATLGLNVSESTIGPASVADPSARCVGTLENVYIAGGVLNIKVPAGAGGGLTAGEVIFEEELPTGGVFSMEAKIDKTEGTCQSLFTYTTIEGTSDELDMEMLGNNIFKPGQNGDQGIGLSNYQPDGAKDGAHAAYPNDPTADFNRYTIGWFSDSNKFYYNDEELKGPEPHLPVNPCSIVINNWSNGDPGFTQGPPAQDNILQVRKLEYYYQTEEHSIYPALAPGCSVENACQAS
ncbi:hypothetical protein I302_108261 [Kwoniella bestiolae CBS 10118]|uniref:GH16 domain-containing protein n=1 Tax=Kwoniella bestiolae CBS 10118 TaxID=1296100 RepID=A0AAJ8MD09_9TREE